MDVLALTANSTRRTVQAFDRRNDNPKQAPPDDDNAGVYVVVLALLEDAASTSVTVHSSQRA